MPDDEKVLRALSSEIYEELQVQSIFPRSKLFNAKSGAESKANG